MHYGCITDTESQAPASGDGVTAGERPASEADAKRGRESDQQRGTGENAPICGKGLGEQDGAARSAARPAALPCQNSNNSDKPAKRYRLKSIPGSGGLFYKSNDNERAVWKKLDGDTIERWGLPSGAEAKAAFQNRSRELVAPRSRTPLNSARHYRRDNGRLLLRQKIRPASQITAEAGLTSA
jgi:hypothetical protein